MDFSQIRPANSVDVFEIEELFKLATDTLSSMGINQWHYNYPKAEHIIEDILQQTCFVFMVDRKIAGTITIDSNQSEQYKNVHWQYPSELCFVIHRLGVHPQYQGKKIGKTLCYYAEFLAHKNQVPCIRLDVYSQNPISNELYRSLGYSLAEGYCHFHGNDAPFLCYEKKIDLLSCEHDPNQTIFLP